MSKQSTKREIAIAKDSDDIENGAAKAVSDLVKYTALVKLHVVFLHDNLLNNKGDLSEGDRVDTRNLLVPLYPQVSDCLAEIESLFNIYNADLATWQANFDAYLIDNPTTLDEALSRFPTVT